MASVNVPLPSPAMENEADERGFRKIPASLTTPVVFAVPVIVITALVKAVPPNVPETVALSVYVIGAAWSPVHQSATPTERRAIFILVARERRMTLSLFHDDNTRKYIRRRPCPQLYRRIASLVVMELSRSKTVDTSFLEN